MCRVHDMFNKNAVSVCSNLGDGNFRMLGLTLYPMDYTFLSPTTFAAPHHPGEAPILPHAANVSQISNILRVFAKEEAVYQRFDILVKALNALLLGDFEKIFLESSRNPCVGLTTRLPIEILNHLYDFYSAISTANLSENDNRMRSQFNVNLPIEGLFCQIQDTVYFADAGGSPYTPFQILNMEYQLVFQSGIFPKDCCIWKRFPDPYKTCPKFKLDFNRAFKEYREIQENTPAVAGFRVAPALTSA